MNIAFAGILVAWRLSLLGLLLVMVAAVQSKGDSLDLNMILGSTEYSTLASLVKAANLTRKDLPSSFTIFAPNNDALEATTLLSSFSMSVLSLKWISTSCLTETCSVRLRLTWHQAISFCSKGPPLEANCLINKLKCLDWAHEAGSTSDATCCVWM